jgi:hypothetical protein
MTNFFRPTALNRKLTYPDETRFNALRSDVEPMSSESPQLGNRRRKRFGSRDLAEDPFP